MAAPKYLKQKWESLDESQQTRLIRMAWEDRTAFESIEKVFQISPNDVERIMRIALPPRDYRRWRVRANQRGHLKHGKKRPKAVDRFKCSRQRLDGSTKGWK